MSEELIPCEGCAEETPLSRIMEDGEGVMLCPECYRHLLDDSKAEWEKKERESGQ